eukprot:GHVU01053978.1.p4 GENE.GHVU01053978.1~~GHVU01053978.1.p4  ORF type:complete len:118 (+),score=11.71 GHVU01053978.1:147-500(+)
MGSRRSAAPIRRRRGDNWRCVDAPSSSSTSVSALLWLLLLRECGCRRYQQRKFLSRDTGVMESSKDEYAHGHTPARTQARAHPNSHARTLHGDIARPHVHVRDRMPKQSQPTARETW